MQTLRDSMIAARVSLHSTKLCLIAANDSIENMSRFVAIIKRKFVDAFHDFQFENSSFCQKLFYP